MNSRGEGSGAPAWSDADRALCVAYIDGLLDQREQLEFERRLSDEPALAARVRALMETDELLRGAKAQTVAQSERAKSRRPLVWAASLAAAAALLVWLGMQLVSTAPAARFEVALAPSFEAARDYVANVPQLAGLSARGVEALRGGETAENTSPERFVELARAAELESARRQLAQAPHEPLAAGYFVLPVELAHASEVLVFAARRDQPFELLHPAGESRAPLQLAAGLHVLPNERFELVGQGASLRVRYQRGFLTPLGAEQLRLVVAVRALDERRDPAFRAPQGLDEAALRAALTQAGFELRELSVREPR